MKRFRLSVFKSNKHIFAQVIDDEAGKTLVAISDVHIKDKPKKRAEVAREVGKLLAKKALAKKIKSVFFDRRRYKYHGIIKELASGAREAGLKF